jgi:hypothetical protein
MDSRDLPATLLAVSGAAMDKDTEVEVLRARVAELERELASRTERANAAVAAAQDRLYWLDRWHIDANRVLGSRAGRVAFEAGRLARRLLGSLRRLTR